MPESDSPPVAHEVQITPAHVLEALNSFRTEVNLRLDTQEGTLGELQIKVDKVTETVTEGGLNGHTPLLKAFLEQYAATYQERQAWQTLVGAWAHRLHWLASPKAWLRAIFYAALGGIGYGLVSGGQLPHFPHLG